MVGVSIFGQSWQLTIINLSLFAFFLTCIYTSIGNSNGKVLWLIFGAFFADYFSSYIGNISLEVYSKGGSVLIWIFFEIVFAFAAMLLLVLAASKILLQKNADYTIVYAFGGIGIFAIVAFLFVFPDNEKIAQMRDIFPLSGLAYLAISFLAQIRKKHCLGYVLIGLLSLSSAIVLLLKLGGITDWVYKTWYLSSILYLLMSFSTLLIKADYFAQKLDESNITIEKNNQRLEEIIKFSPFPIMISKLSDDSIILANTNAIKLFGLSATELERYHLKDFFVDVENRHLLNECLEKEKVVQDFELLVKTPNANTPFWLLVSANIIDYNYDVALYMAFQDITSRKNREALLKNQATRDPLTSLYNRRYFEEEVLKRIVKAKSTNEPFSVLMIDADHFKNVNDTYGHKTGDKVLIELASTCERALRDVDIVARYGGEEFVVFLSGVNAQKGKIVADRLRETISEAVVHSEEGKEVKFTVSIGVSSYEISDNIDTLIKTADEALYKAKENGRNRVEIFNLDDKKEFENKEIQERIKNEESNRHPIFNQEEDAEISLLDGIEGNHIQEQNTKIEENKKETYPILGVDEEDL